MDIKSRVQRFRLLAVKWFKRLVVACALIFLAYIGIYLYAQKIVSNTLSEPHRATSTQPVEVNWQALKADKNATTKYHARLIINYSKKSPVAWYDLLAIANHESMLWDFVGDGGQSFGLFHIYVSENNDISYKEALNPLTALAWTEGKLLERGYKENRFEAIGRHQGGNKINRIYAYDVLETAEKLRAYNSR